MTWGLGLLWAAVSAQEETQAGALACLWTQLGNRRTNQGIPLGLGGCAGDRTGLLLRALELCTWSWTPVHLSPVDTRQLLERDLWFIRTKVSMTDRQPLFAF